MGAMWRVKNLFPFGFMTQSKTLPYLPLQSKRKKKKIDVRENNSGSGPD
jgi:hypothetical protein